MTSRRISLLALLLILCLPLTAGAALIVGKASLDGAQEVPPNASKATGEMSLILDSASGKMKVSGEVIGISIADITFPGGGLAFGALGPFHIHAAPAGVNGPIVVPFSDAGFFTATATGFSFEAVVDASALSVASLLAGNTYFNLHTLSFGGGEIRGQISAEVIPEPSAAILFGLGAAYVGRKARRRR